MAAATTYVAGVGAYVLHTGSGIRGGGRADRERGRPADIWAVPQVESILSALSAIKRALPADLASWRRHELGPEDAIDVTGPAGPAYVAVKDARFVAVALAAPKGITVTARKPVALQVLHPLTGATVRDAALPAGGSVKAQGAPAFIITGELTSQAR
jgi:hypothetical protein